MGELHAIIVKILDLLMSLVGLLDHLDLALVKHVSHKEESSNHAKNYNSSDDNESSGRSSFLVGQHCVLLFSLDELFFSILENIRFSLLLVDHSS